MIELLATTPTLLVNSFLFGLFTKVADLLNEHGLKLFRGADIVFGLLWGGFGTLVMVFSPLLATFYLAILISWLIRGNIDYLNHRIATAIILISILFSGVVGELDVVLFSLTLVSFTGIRMLIHYNQIKKNFLTRRNLFIFVILAVLMFFNFSYWIVFASYLLNSVAYQSVKYWGKRTLKNY